MLKVKKTEIPQDSIILKNVKKINYSDCYKYVVPDQISVDRALNILFTIPFWVEFLLTLRNTAVKYFGLRTDNTKTRNLKEYYEIEDRAVFFTVINRNENEIVMGEKDNHLDFLTSVYVNNGNNSEGSDVSIITIVQFNNCFGKAYFTLIKPFHRIIIKSILKNLSKKGTKSIF